MPQELGLLVVFLLVFLFDTFMPKKSLGALPVFMSVIFGAFTLANYFMLTRGTAFSGMFETTASTFTMKAILNIGMLIVLVQSIKWSNSEFQAVRRGEYYELLEDCLFGEDADSIARLLSIGSSSGSDILSGMLAVCND